MAGFLSLDELFEGRHFDREIIVLCVSCGLLVTRWTVAGSSRLKNILAGYKGTCLLHTKNWTWLIGFPCRGSGRLRRNIPLRRRAR
jgi:hypothetical protein